jgi:hypothetical protein
VTFLTRGLPAGFNLTEISQGRWRLEVPVGDLVAFHLDSDDPVVLRRAAFGIANLGEEWGLPRLVEQITTVLGPDAEEIVFTGAFDAFEVDVAGRPGRPGFLDRLKRRGAVKSTRGGGSWLAGIFGRRSS